MAQERTEEGLRAQRVNVRLSPGMFDRLSAVADGMGMTTSTVAAVAIAEYVQAKEQRHAMAIEGAKMGAERAGKALEQFFSDPKNLVALASSGAQIDIEEITGR